MTFVKLDPLTLPKPAVQMVHLLLDRDILDGVDVSFFRRLMESLEISARRHAFDWSHCAYWLSCAASIAHLLRKEEKTIVDPRRNGIGAGRNDNNSVNTAVAAAAAGPRAAFDRHLDNTLFAIYTRLLRSVYDVSFSSLLTPSLT